MTRQPFNTLMNYDAARLVASYYWGPTLPVLNTEVLLYRFVPIGTSQNVLIIKASLSRVSLIIEAMLKAEGR